MMIRCLNFHHCFFCSAILCEVNTPQSGRKAIQFYPFRWSSILTGLERTFWHLSWPGWWHRLLQPSLFSSSDFRLPWTLWARRKSWHNHTFFSMGISAWDRFELFRPENWGTCRHRRRKIHTYLWVALLNPIHRGQPGWKWTPHWRPTAQGTSWWP